MPFEVPTKSFDHIEHAKNKVLRANQLEETILQQFKSLYEDFWGVSGSDKTETVDGVEATTFFGTGSRYSVEEMQLILNTLGMTAIEIITAAGGLIQFIEAAYPGSLPDRYKSAAFEYELTQSGIKLTKLADVWAAPAVKEEVVV